MAPPPFTPEELERYGRHLVLPEIGMEGQKKLKGSRVLVVGAGGLGSPAALYLAAAGIGTLGVLDQDAVDLSNLQRQIIHGSGTVGQAKSGSAAARLRDLNRDIDVVPLDLHLTPDNAEEVISPYDVVVDCTDNFPSRYLLNDACVRLGKPDVYGSVYRFEGQASVFAVDRGGPCYRCLYPDPPDDGLVPSCADTGVLGVLPGIVGSIQATEVIKLIVGVGDPLVGRLLTIDALSMKFREVRAVRNPECPVCGTRGGRRNVVQQKAEKDMPLDWDMSVRELKDRLDGGKGVVLLDIREPTERERASIGGLFIPMRELPGRLGELDPESEIVVYCHHGNRSASITAFLRSRGYSRARNLAGGIDRWSREIDPTVPLY